MSDACQIDFYVLPDSKRSAEQLVCRLSLMAWEKGNRVMVLAENEPQAEGLDALMWEYPPGRFLPHARESGMANAPVVISTLGDVRDGKWDVIINLRHDPVPAPERFRRLLEFVPAPQDQRGGAREKFRIYRTQGHNPKTTVIGNQEPGTGF